MCLIVVVHDTFCCRPPPSQRKFNSTIINSIINNVTSQLKDPIIAKIFNCTFPNTLDTTVNYSESLNDTFIITGDINAMWLRDSTWQVAGYIDYANQDSHLKSMLIGLSNRLLNSVLIDPFANAFNYDNNSNGNQNDIRTPPMNGYIYEGKS